MVFGAVSSVVVVGRVAGVEARALVCAVKVTSEAAAMGVVRVRTTVVRAAVVIVAAVHVVAVAVRVVALVSAVAGWRAGVMSVVTVVHVARTAVVVV